MGVSRLTVDEPVDPKIVEKVQFGEQFRQEVWPMVANSIRLSDLPRLMEQGISPE